MSDSSFLANLPDPAPPGQDFDYTRALDSFLPIARGVAVSPVSFFAALPRRGNDVGPLVFALICAEISGVLSGIIGVIEGRSIIGFIVSLITTPIGAAIGLFIVAAIAHVLVILIVGSTNSGFEATFRVATYASVTSLATWIPIIGPLIGLYGAYLAVVGIREMHQTTTRNALLVVLIPIAIGIILAILVGLSRLLL